MGEAVYILCTLTSALCALLLMRSFKQQRTSLVFWSAVCFVGLTLTNALLFVDLVLVVDADLSLLRSAISAASMAVLAVALAWSSRSS